MKKNETPRNNLTRHLRLGVFSLSPIKTGFQNTRSGQALVLLLVFVSIAIIITSAAVVMVAVNSRTNAASDLGNSAFDVAESGAENAILRLLRNPSYPGETLAVSQGFATITVTPGNFPKTITSAGSYNNYKRTIQVVLGYNNSQYTISSWKEIPL